jgi:two-component system sensor histidine kinase/response regulator
MNFLNNGQLGGQASGQAIGQPSAPSSVRHPVAHAAAAQAARGGLPKVLVVDDLERNILALLAMLGRADLQLLPATSGPQALELILQHDLALALIDVQMPGMDGFELAELMRGNERSRNIPIIFLTASVGDPSKQFRGYEAGAVDFLSKPLDAFVLRSKIEVFVHLHAQQRRLAQKLAELEESLRLNELFTAVLGHDLRSPLSSVLTNAEMLKHLAPGGQIAGIAGRISASGERMARLISQILDLARVRAQTFRLSPSQCDLHQVCLAVQEELEPTGTARRLRIEKAGTTTAVFDADRIAQMLTNLVGNALMHGAAGEPVEMIVDGTDPDRVTVSVRNHGSLEAATLPALFQPFGIASAADRGSPQGLGLGLQIVRQIVTLHGGSITAENEPPDSVVFRVRLPRAGITA